MFFLCLLTVLDIHLLQYDHECFTVEAALPLTWTSIWWVETGFAGPLEGLQSEY